MKRVAQMDDVSLNPLVVIVQIFDYLFGEMSVPLWVGIAGLVIIIATARIWHSHIINGDILTLSLLCFSCRTCSMVLAIGWNYCCGLVCGLALG